MANKDIKIQIKAVNKTRRAFLAVTAGLGGIAKAAFSMKTAIGLAAGALGIGGRRGSPCAPTAGGGRHD